METPSTKKVRSAFVIAAANSCAEFNLVSILMNPDWEDYRSPRTSNGRAARITHKLVQDKLGITPEEYDQLRYGERSLTPEEAGKLSVTFGNEAAFWIDKQNRYNGGIRVYLATPLNP